MLADIYMDPVAIERLRTGPAGTHLDNFVGWLLGLQYSKHTIRAYVAATVDFMTWVAGIGLSEGALGQPAIDGYRGHLVAAGRWEYGYGKTSNYYTGARRFVAFLREIGIAPEPVVQEPAEVVAFRAWLHQHRGLRPLTVDTYVRVVLDLIKDLGPEPRRYDAASLRSFVLHQASRHSTSKAKNVVTAVRNYLRFLIATDKCPPGLDDAIPRIAGWRLSTLPRHLATEDVQQIIAACDCTTAAGARDRAVVLLLARLALRADDVAGLRFRDIHWDEGKLLVSGKTRQESWLPLPQEVGDAILDYVDHGRPVVDENAVFVNTTAPYRPITSATVSKIARRAILRADVEAPSYGAHVFRHSAATTLLRRGVPLQDIGVIMRHDSIESVAYYAKVDLELLRSIARPWPGRPSC